MPSRSSKSSKAERARSRPGHWRSQLGLLVPLAVGLVGCGDTEARSESTATPTAAPLSATTLEKVETTDAQAKPATTQEAKLPHPTPQRPPTDHGHGTSQRVNP